MMYLLLHMIVGTAYGAYQWCDGACSYGYAFGYSFVHNLLGVI